VFSNRAVQTEDYDQSAARAASLVPLSEIYIDANLRRSSHEFARSILITLSARLYAANCWCQLLVWSSNQLQEQPFEVARSAPSFL
jgi:hypothetical protein